METLTLLDRCNRLDVLNAFECALLEDAEMTIIAYQSRSDSGFNIIPWKAYPSMEMFPQLAQ